MIGNKDLISIKYWCLGNLLSKSKQENKICSYFTLSRKGQALSPHKKVSLPIQISSITHCSMFL